MKITDDLAAEAVRTLISWIGDDPSRPGLLDTPRRVLAAWRECWGKGYSDLNFVVTDFENEGDNDQMIIEKNIVFYTFCEHHLALFHGVAAVAYIPCGRIVGLSKLARIVEHFSARLQVQERLVKNIADFVGEKISPDCAVMLEASHSCMTSRGVRQPKSTTITTALRGIFKTDGAAHQEFLLQVKKD